MQPGRLPDHRVQHCVNWTDRDRRPANLPPMERPPAGQRSRPSQAPLAPLGSPHRNWRSAPCFLPAWICPANAMMLVIAQRHFSLAAPMSNANSTSERPRRAKPGTESLHPRERMIRSALVLMGEQGVEATSFSQVLEHSGAPRGSIYHHFPGGKAQLVEEATQYAGDRIAKLLTRAVDEHDDPVAAVEALSNFWSAVLHNSDFTAGCPVLAATLEADRSPAA